MKFEDTIAEKIQILVAALETIAAQATPHEFKDGMLIPHRHNAMAEWARIALRDFYGDSNHERIEKKD